MYSTCLFCNKSLGTNEMVETFPVGRRLAFDQRRGRLWVVCRKCEKWNLTPLEERWDAIETCERLFRDTRKRVSTDHIGLARLHEGLELVRIGEPLRPEFAAWRYGDQFGRRRTRGMIQATGVVVAGVGMVALLMARQMVGGALLVATSQIVNVGWQLALHGGLAYRKRRILGEIPTDDGKRWLVRGRYLQTLRLIPAASGDGWGLEVGCDAGGVRRRLTIEGPEARRLATKLVPTFNPDGGRKEDVLRAVTRIEARGDAESYLRWLARNTRSERNWMKRKDPVTGERIPAGASSDTLGVQGTEVAMAVEMAVNEENERHALESELEFLEEAWKDAEEIASISDRLVLPTDLDTRLTDLKRKKQLTAEDAK
jgi:hypothetical protein